MIFSSKAILALPRYLQTDCLVMCASILPKNTVGKDESLHLQDPLYPLQEMAVTFIQIQSPVNNFRISHSVIIAIQISSFPLRIYWILTWSISWFIWNECKLISKSSSKIDIIKKINVLSIGNTEKITTEEEWKVTFYS